MLAESRCDRPRHDNRPSAAGRLRFAENVARPRPAIVVTAEHSRDPLERPTDAKYPSVEIDVRPSEPERLALPEAEHRRDLVECLQPIALRRVQKSARLLRIERRDLMPPDAWAGDEHRHVAGDKAVAECLIQRGAEDGLRVLDGPRGEATRELRGEEFADVLGRQLRQRNALQRRPKMEPDVALVGDALRRLGGRVYAEFVRDPVAATAERRRLTTRYDDQ